MHSRARPSTPLTLTLWHLWRPHSLHFAPCTWKLNRWHTMAHYNNNNNNSDSGRLRICDRATPICFCWNCFIHYFEYERIRYECDAMRYDTCTRAIQFVVEQKCFFFRFAIHFHFKRVWFHVLMCCVDCRHLYAFRTGNECTLAPHTQI